MTSPFVQFFEKVNFSSSYKELSAHQIWFNLRQGKQSYGGWGAKPAPPPQVENVLNRPGEIGLNTSHCVAEWVSLQVSVLLHYITAPSVVRVSTMLHSPIFSYNFELVYCFPAFHC